MAVGWPLHQLSQWSEPSPNLLGEQLGLFPGRKVATLFDLVELDQVLAHQRPRTLTGEAGEAQDGVWAHELHDWQRFRLG
jgi:hypothetical protein